MLWELDADDSMERLVQQFCYESMGETESHQAYHQIVVAAASFPTWVAPLRSTVVPIKKLSWPH